MLVELVLFAVPMLSCVVVVVLVVLVPEVSGGAEVPVCMLLVPILVSGVVVVLVPAALVPVVPVTPV